MAPTILTALAGFCIFLEISYGAVDSGVKVFGTTVGPNFKRAEGMRKYILIIGKQ